MTGRLNHGKNLKGTRPPGGSPSCSECQPYKPSPPRDDSTVCNRSSENDLSSISVLEPDVCYCGLNPAPGHATWKCASGPGYLTSS